MRILPPGPAWRSHKVTRMPLAVAAMTLLPLLWRAGAEVRGWRPLPALLRHALTVVALVVLAWLSFLSVVFLG